MKKILLLLTMIMMVTVADAQFGVKGGYTISTFNTDADNAVKDGTPAIPSRKANRGYTYGIVYSHCLGCDFTFQPEVSYTVKGQSYTTNNNRSVEVDLKHLDIPLNFKWKFYKPLYIYAGPILSFALDRKQIIKTSTTTLEGDNIDKGFKTWDLGLNAGLGLQYKRFFIDARVTRGYRKQDRTVVEQSTSFSPYSFRNFTSQFTAGIFF